MKKSRTCQEGGTQSQNFFLVFTDELEKLFKKLLP